VIERMSANPRQFPVVHKNIRRALLRRFPYALMFVIDDVATLTGIACFHGGRDPAHWQKRASTTAGEACVSAGTLPSMAIMDFRMAPAITMPASHKGSFVPTRRGDLSGP
jgi:hypothetical protein